jgi:hypothetical protein
MTAKKKLTSLKAKRITSTKATAVKGGARRADWTVGHVTSVKFPK